MGDKFDGRGEGDDHADIFSKEEAVGEMKGQGREDQLVKNSSAQEAGREIGLEKIEKNVSHVLQEEEVMGHDTVVVSNT